MTLTVAHCQWDIREYLQLISLAAQTYVLTVIKRSSDMGAVCYLGALWLASRFVK